MMGKKRTQVLDPKLAFELWKQTSSCRKAAMQLANMGIISPRTGRALTGQAVSNAAYLYMIHNLEEGRQGLREIFQNNGEILDDETWKRVVKERATYVLQTPSARERWFNAHPEFQ